MSLVNGLVTKISSLLAVISKLNEVLDFYLTESLVLLSDE